MSVAATVRRSDICPVLGAASASVAVGHAALDAAVASYPDQRFALRNGIQIIRDYTPKKTLSNTQLRRVVL